MTELVIDIGTYICNRTIPWVFTIDFFDGVYDTGEIRFT